MLDDLIRGLKGGSEEQQIRVARALGDPGDRRAGPLLLGVLETTENPRVRNAAALGLAALGDTMAVPALRRQLWLPHNATNRGTLVWALRELNARSAVVDLARLICEAVYEPAWMAVLAIEAFDGPVQDTDRQRAIAILEECRAQGEEEDWRREIIDYALALLHQCGTEVDTEP